jgi:SepF-like predicted cell division protein (DUF552 family)
MSNLTDAQAALAAANVVLADVKVLGLQANQMMDMLERAQTSAAPVSPDIMALERTIIANMATLLTDITATVAAGQTVVTDLGG